MFEAANVYVDGPVVVDEGERWLIEDLQLCPNNAFGIDEVLEIAHEVVFYEDLHRANVVGSARKAEEGDLVTEFLLHRCDRRGFCTTARSPGSPEPDDCVLASEIVGIELGAADRVGHEPW